MSSLSKPATDYTQEVRFAIVMYGGISLAIYINGVAQELLHLVRATAPVTRLDDDPSSQPLAKYADAELSGAEPVYRKLGQMLVRGGKTSSLADIEEFTKHASECTGDHPDHEGLCRPPDIRTRFVVDILSGSSAGGINAVFLAKALANDQLLKNLESLWVQEGDMQVLINDRESLAGTELRLQDPPKSLLNSQRMYWELLDALDGMEESATSTLDGATNVEELDLFVTATDMRGQIINLQLSDRVVQERRHRKVFHFVFNTEKDPLTGLARNDFVAENNPFLAFAARATSAHPAAFEPMTLAGIDNILERHERYQDQLDLRSDFSKWQTFYKEYLQRLDSERGAATSDEDLKERVRRFSQRAFNDGGVLNNQPFSHTLDTLPKHHSGFPTVRKLLYIEPAPEHPKNDPGQAPPDFVENAWLSLSTLPRYEPIREHLQRVLERNHLVERVEHITLGMEKDIQISGRPKTYTVEEFKKQTLADMIRDRGYGWASYQRLRVSETSDEVALLIARSAGFDEDSDEFRAIGLIVRYWRGQRYQPYSANSDSGIQTETAFLMNFDLVWRLRRIRFLMGKLDDLACFDEAGEETFTHAFKGFQAEAPYPRNSDEERPQRVRLRQTLKASKALFHQAFNELRQRRQKLWSIAVKKVSLGDLNKSKIEEDIDRVRAALGRIKISGADLNCLLEADKTRREDELKRIYEANVGAFSDLEVKLRDVLAEWIGDARRKCEEALRRDDKVDPPVLREAESLEADQRAMLHALWFYFDYFDFYDMVTHPILYATNVGDELDHIEVFRVSPEDATALLDERKTKKKKLAGTLFANFGAFFKRDFRTNDILWGRLDGAERIITSLLPDARYDRSRCQLAKEYDPTRDTLIRQAHDGILKEVLGVKDDSELLRVLKELAECADDKSKTDAANQASAPESPRDERDFTPTAQQNLANYLTDAQVRFGLTSFLKGQTPSELFVDQFNANYESLRKFNNQDMVQDASRASKVFGKMLEGYAKDKQIDNKRVAWFSRLASLFWGLVQVAIPGSIASIVFQHWLKLLYLFEFLLILLGTLLTNHAAQQFGWLTFGITVAIHTAQLVLATALEGKHWFRNFLVALLGLAVVLLTALGVVLLLGIFYSQSIWSTLAKIQTWQVNPYASGAAPVKTALIALVGAFLIRSLWKGVGEDGRTRIFAVLPLVLGLAITSGMIYSFAVAAQRPQSLPGRLHMPGLAIEMVRQPADVVEVEKFASTNGQDQIAGAQKLRAGVNIDFGFIALYTAVFLVFSYWLRRRNLPRALGIAVIAAVFAIATAGFDVLENVRLYAVLRSALPDPLALEDLHIATLLKWIFCFGTTAMLSPLFLSRNDFGYLFGWGMLAVVAAGISGLFYPPLLELAFFALGLLLLLIGVFGTAIPERLRSG